MSRDETPHIRKASRLDRLLNKSFPTEKERQEMVALLSEIQDPTPKEKWLLEISEELITPDEPAKDDSLAEKLRTAEAAIRDALEESGGKNPELERAMLDCIEGIGSWTSAKEAGK